MSYAYLNLVQEARQLAVAKQWGPSYTQFWQQVEAGTLSREMFDLFTIDFAEYLERYKEFGSTVLHRVNFDLMLVLSNTFVHMTRMMQDSNLACDEVLLHLPATESLCNQLLIEAEMNPVSYLVLHTIFLEFALPKKNWGKVLAEMNIPHEQGAFFARAMNVLYQKAVQPEMVDPHVALKPTDRAHVLSQVVIMLEMIDLLYREMSSQKRLTLADLELAVL